MEYYYGIQKGAGSHNPVWTYIFCVCIFIFSNENCDYFLCFYYFIMCLKYILRALRRVFEGRLLVYFWTLDLLKNIWITPVGKQSYAQWRLCFLSRYGFKRRQKHVEKFGNQHKNGLYKAFLEFMKLFGSHILSLTWSLSASVQKYQMITVLLVMQMIIFANKA